MTCKQTRKYEVCLKKLTDGKQQGEEHRAAPQAGLPIERSGVSPSVFKIYKRLKERANAPPKGLSLSILISFRYRLEF